MPPFVSESLAFYRSLSPQPVTLLRVFGEDAFGYLQSQVSADLRATGNNWVRYTLWLDARGHVLADSFVLREAEESFLLFSYAIAAERLQAIIEANIIADDVEIETLGEGWSHWALWADQGRVAARADAVTCAKQPQNEGAATLQIAAQTPADAFAALPDNVRSLLPQAGSYRALSSSGHIPAESESAGGPVPAVNPAATLLFGGRNASGLNFDLLLPPQADVPAALASVFTKTRWNLREARRIADGIAAIPADIGGGDLPQEGGDLVRVAVSTAKGCYLGQEVIARWHATGQARSGLFRICLLERNGGGGGRSVSDQGSTVDVSIAAPSLNHSTASVTAQPLPLRVYAGKKPVGELRSFCALTGNGLALLKIHRLDGARELSLEPDGAAQIRILEPMLS